MAFAFFALLTWQGIGELRYSWEIREATMGTIRFPLYPARFLLVLGAALLLLRLALDIVGRPRPPAARRAAARAVGQRGRRVTTSRGQTPTMPLLSPEVAGYIVVGLLLAWLALGVHIGVALGLAGFIGIFLTVGPDAALAQIATLPFGTTNSFALAVIPLFILMGSFATVAAITTDLFRAAYVWIGNLRGGLAMATVMSSAAFGAASGSTIVNAAVFTKMAMPEMTRFGYDVRLSAGCIAAAGTLAALIPPSILMVVYAVITEQSIGKLLIAGIVPGILTALIYCGGIYVIARWRPDLAPRANLTFSWSERLQRAERRVRDHHPLRDRDRRHLRRLLPRDLRRGGGRVRRVRRSPSRSAGSAWPRSRRSSRRRRSRLR